MLFVQPAPGAALAEDEVPPAAQWIEPAGQTVTVRFTKGEMLAGKILMPDGSPAVGARVMAFDPEKNTSSAPAKTGEDGAFRLAFPAGGRPHLSASLSAPDGRFLIGFLESVAAGAKDIEIRLHPKGK